MGNWAFSEVLNRGLVVFQLIIQQIQYISLFNQLDINWPAGFREGYNGLEVVNINLNNYVTNVHLPLVDFRGLFTIIAVMCPIATTFAILLLFQPFLLVCFYGVLSFGSVVFIAGLIGRFLTGVGLTVTQQGANTYIIAGSALIAGAVVSMISYKVATRGQPVQTEEEKVSQLKAQEEYYKKFHRMRTFRHFLSSALLILAGCTVTNLLSFGFDTVLANSTNINIWVYVGYILLAIGFGNAVYFVACLTETGRAAQQRLTQFIAQYGLMILLVFVGSTFIPVLTYSLQMMMCKSYTCPQDTSFNPYAFRPQGSWDVSESRYCDGCNFIISSNDTCPSGLLRDLIYATHCNPNGGLISKRSWLYPETTCEGAATGFFQAAAIIAMVSYGMTIPMVYFFVIRYLTRKIETEVSYGGINSDESEVQWTKRITLVMPVAGSLYDAYKHTSRFFVLFSLFQRVLIMVVLVVIAPFAPGAAVVLVFAVFAIYSIGLSATRPHIHGFERGLAIGLGGCNVFNGVAALYVWRNGGGTDYTLVAIYTGINIAIPIATAFFWHRRSSAPVTAAAMHLDEVTKETMRNKEKILNKTTGQVHLSRFFMTIGVFFVIAFGACIVGMLQTPEIPNKISTDALYQTNAMILAGYSSWSDMTASCCCIQSANPTSGFAVGERWLCANGKVIERGRQLNNGDSSIPLRDVCASKPISGCNILTDSDGVPYMSCAADVYAVYVPNIVPKIAYKYFF